MRRLHYILFAAGLIGLGCTSTGKKPPAPNHAPGRDESAPFWTEGKSTKGGLAPSPRASEGMLAGMLIDDSSGKPQPNAVIDVTPADAGPEAKPIGTEADEQGYFTIKGLKAGTTYFLRVRSEEGGHVLAGSAMTQATNTRMLIRLSEKNLSSVTPPPRQNPGTTGPFAPDKKDGKPKLMDPPTSSVPRPDPVPAPKDPLIETDQSWAPGKTPPTSRPVLPPPPVAPSNPNVADTKTNISPPPASVPGPGNAPPKMEPPPPPLSPMMSAVPSNSSPIPVGAVGAPPEQRHNFTVYDLRGDPVAFRTLAANRRLIVLDFWMTDCLPCLHAIPELIDLQSRYAGYVTVAGIACDDRPWAQRKKAVEGIKDYYLRKTPKPINYSLFLEGEGSEGRVQNEFMNIKDRRYPTLVLLDYTGRKLWQGNSVRQLEDKLRYHLQR